MYDDFNYLAKDFTMIFYDMRNRGRSSSVSDSSKLGIRYDVSDLEAVRRYFNLDSVYLIGHSYLGMMVALYATQYPQHVKKIVQIGPVPMSFNSQYPPDQVNMNRPRPDSLAYAKLNQAFDDGLYERDPKAASLMVWNVASRISLVADPKYLDKMGKQYERQMDYPNEWYRNVMRHLKFHFGTIQQLKFPKDSLSYVKCPVLVIHGMKDLNAPFGSGLEWAKTFPDARLISVPDAGHIPWVEHPEMVFSQVSEFLNGIWPVSAFKIVN
jgi:pimeloyl-ACP methyl ester carboxylesterase